MGNRTPIALLSPSLLSLPRRRPSSTYDHQRSHLPRCFQSKASMPTEGWDLFLQETPLPPPPARACRRMCALASSTGSSYTSSTLGTSRAPSIPVRSSAIRGTGWPDSASSVPRTPGSISRCRGKRHYPTRTSSALHAPSTYVLWL
ncbi:hypothetical protein PsYK624_161190 [Phanerochaete sordida]|uniref:Uncharacterized protein n=1 Tax=Phanerochaete sordida TaxID=48140 RepID=A0A9P3GQE5_9APHY|nr:hypothetical protein PsYK624_161190 [Phanerochaete sordida]